jgi:hypothetical protein
VAIITSSTLSANQLSGRFNFGCGIENSGTLTLIASTISGNNTFNAHTALGGGIDNSGTLTIIASTVSGNSAQAHGIGGVREAYGGGIYNDGTLTVIASTLNGNSADSGTFANGGGICNSGTLTLTESTLNGNSAVGGFIASGGGISNGSVRANPGTVSIQNTIVAGNSIIGDYPDMSGALYSLGHNLIGIGDGGSGYADTDLVGTSASPLDPMLGPLQDNGGPTWTMALLPSSPGIDAGALTDSEWDQRGPGYARLVDGATDIGAYEVQNGGEVAPSAHPRLFPEAVILMPANVLCWPLAQTATPVDTRPAQTAEQLWSKGRRDTRRWAD